MTLVYIFKVGNQGEAGGTVQGVSNGSGTPAEGQAGAGGTVQGGIEKHQVGTGAYAGRARS